VTKPIAVQLWSLRAEATRDFKGVLRALAEMGYAGVQPAGLHGLSYEELRATCAELGLRVAGSHGPSARRDNLTAVVEDARGTGQNLVWTGYSPEDFADEHAIRATATEVNECHAALAAQGLRLFVHNHSWEFERLPDGKLKYELFCELCPDVELEIDIYWAANFGAEDPAAWIRRLRQRTSLLHVKDGPLVRGDENVALGHGKVDVRAAVQAADPEVLEWLIVELDSCDGDMLAAVEESFRYLVAEGLGHGQKR
jgi:sugar phosphate isomerase/epimerase